MTEKSFKKKGFAIGQIFEVEGKYYRVSSCHNSFKFMLEEFDSNGRWVHTLLTRANLDTIYNKILKEVE